MIKQIIVFMEILNPKPFTTIVEAFGEPFHVPNDLLSEDVPAFCKKLETIFQELTLEDLD